MGADTILNHATVGDYTYFGRRCEINYANIGKFCSIASEVHVGLGTHPLTNVVSTHPNFYLSGNGRFADRNYLPEYLSTTVGNDVWIGLRASVRDGLTIGDGAVVAAGAIVVKDVPPYAVVAGVPAKVLRYRFSPDIIKVLLDFRWWDKDEEWIEMHWRKFHDVNEFVGLIGKTRQSELHD